MTERVLHEWVEDGKWIRQISADGKKERIRKGGEDGSPWSIWRALSIETEELARLAARVAELEERNALYEAKNGVPLEIDRLGAINAILEVKIRELEAKGAKLRAFITLRADSLRRAFGPERSNWVEVIAYDADRADVDNG